MPRATDIMVVLAYAIVAGAAAVAFDRFGLMSSELAWIMGAVVFLIAGQVHAAAARIEERAETARDIKSLKAANRSLKRALEHAEARLDAIDPDGARAIDIPGRGEGAPVGARAGEAPGEPAPAAQAVQTADSEEDRLIAALIARLEAAGGLPEGAARRAAASASAESEIAPEPEIDIEPGAQAAADIREALDENRVDLYLQPVVGLPQRRTYFYEGFTRLRDRSGAVIAPADFLAAAEAAGLIAEVDNLLLFRCVQIVRRLTRTDRRVGIFCNISMRSLADETFFPEFLDFLRRNSDLAGSLIFELPHGAFEARSAVAARNMARLADYGFRFSIDQVRDLDIDLAELQRAGVRFAKVEGALLLSAARGEISIAGREPGAVAPEDVAGVFARYGVDLVAEKIEAEATVVEVLDLDIAYAQGHLFGAPRPVREDVIAEADGAQRQAG